jgi:hypothetical protein
MTSTRMEQLQRPIERRRSPRWSFQADLTGLTVDADGRRSVETLKGVDISKTGLGAIATRDHYVGQHLVIGLPEPNGRTRYIHGRVVRAHPGQTGQRLGIQFSDNPCDLGCWLNRRLAA